MGKTDSRRWNGRRGICTVEPPSLYVEENREEDDDFLPFGSEVWEYDVADGRQDEFRDAVRNTGLALEVERVEEVEDLPAIEGQ
jgi:hypothetical protein